MESAAKRKRPAALHGAERVSAKIRKEWVEREAPKLARKRGIAEEAARQVLALASSSRMLLGSFELLAEYGTQVAVADLLSDRDRWHGTRFADFLEPDYQNDRRVAWANLKSGGPPYIFSHAHGGCRYRLASELRTIAVRKRERPRIVDECLDAMWAAGEVFGLGDSHALVHVQRGRLVTATPARLLDNLQRLARFQVTKVTMKGPVTEPIDLRENIPNAILAKGSERMLPSISAVITAPTLRADGSRLTETGHDTASGLLLLRDDRYALVPVASDPSPEDALRALVELWRPFRLFPFAGPEDRAVHLAALLTACVRASSPASPGFAYDSHAAGTGKTLLARCVGALAIGRSPSILPPLRSKDDGEVRKRLFALLREGQRVGFLDNVEKPIGGAALNDFLTAPIYRDRVLGAS